MPKLYLDKKKASEAGKKGNKHGPKRKTIIKNSLSIKTIEELKDDVLKVWKGLIESGNEDNRKYAAREISKYVFTQKRDMAVDMRKQISVVVTDLTTESLTKLKTDIENP